MPVCPESQVRRRGVMLQTEAGWGVLRPPSFGPGEVVPFQKLYEEKEGLHSDQNWTQPVPGCVWLEVDPVDLVKSPQMSVVAVVAGLGCGQDMVAPPELGATAVWTRDPPADNCSTGGGIRVENFPPGGGGSRLSPPVLAGRARGVPAAPSFFFMFWHTAVAH